MSALQHLPPRQRAVLVLRDVLRWKASEVAELLGSTVVSVNSALQRARTTMKVAELPDEPGEPRIRVLLEQYVEAFERYDIDGIVSLLHDDATPSMPAYALGLPSTPVTTPSTCSRCSACPSRSQHPEAAGSQ